MSEIEIKPCPFCGEIPEVTYTSGHFPDAICCIAVNCYVNPMVYSDDDAEIFERWNERIDYDKLKAENQKLKDANRWVPVSERLPDIAGRYEVTMTTQLTPKVGSAWVNLALFWGEFDTEDTVLAWREIPEPYQGDL